MPQGIELYRDGEATPYFSTMGGFILGSVALSLGAGGSGNLTDAQLAFGNPFYFAVLDNNALVGLNASFTGTQLNYDAPDGFSGRLFYGIYP